MILGDLAVQLVTVKPGKSHKFRLGFCADYMMFGPIAIHPFVMRTLVLFLAFSQSGLKS
jgi:hypothetical protein